MIFVIYRGVPIFIWFLLQDGAKSLETGCTTDKKMRLCMEPEVIGVRGGSATIPCWFTFESTTSRIKNRYFVMLKHYYKNGDPKVHYADNNIEKNDMFKGRLEKQENASRGYWSMKINNLHMEDEGTYVCRFNFDITNGSYTKKTGFEARNSNKAKRTQLRVNVPPVVHIWKDFVNTKHSRRLLCSAEAKPKPNITWCSSQGYLVNGSEVFEGPSGSNGLQKILSILTITGKMPEESYRCLVENQHGMAWGHVTQSDREGGVLWYVVGCLVATTIALVAAVAFACRWRRNITKGNDYISYIFVDHHEIITRTSVS
uniref:Ig-like domain-containing protein n=1 Tax=Eptatretus burgeri TaxID=7764 RepID=A0A8C4QBZ8_EPTBU